MITKYTCEFKVFLKKIQLAKIWPLNREDPVIFYSQEYQIF